MSYGPTDDEIIPLTVDVLDFDDGPETPYVNRMFPVATTFFARVGIKVEPGVVITASKRFDVPALQDIARKSFDVNRWGGTASIISLETSIGRKMTNEVRSLQSRTHPGRITVALVNQFPMGAKAMGVTFTRAAFNKAPTCFVAKSTVCVDVFWHEISHALLNTGIDDEDHDETTFMMRDPKEGCRGKTITDEQRRKMRATAWDLW